MASTRKMLTTKEKLKLLAAYDKLKTGLIHCSFSDYDLLHRFEVAANDTLDKNVSQRKISDFFTAN